MKSLRLIATGISLLAQISPDARSLRPLGTADIAVAPFTVARDSAGTLRAVADTCLERLVRGLTAKGITVARHPHLSEKNLRSARPAPWAVLGSVSRDHGQFQAELRLLDVESGEEMRSYFNSDTDPEPVGNLGAAAATRIALFVQEQKGSPRPPGE